MLELRDFFHLPQLDRLVTQITATPQGVTVIAGSDAQAPTPDSVEQRFLPSGRSTIFGIFLREWLGADPARKAFIITEKIDSIRVPRQYSRRVEYITIKPPLTFDVGLEMATKRGNGLVVIEHLTPEIAPLLFDASRRGMSVLTQLDTVLRGESVMRQLMPFAREGTDVNVWIVAVQRWRTLCERCKQPEAIEPARLAEIRLRYPIMAGQAVYFREGKCAECHMTGRRGDVAAFDLWQTYAGVSSGPLSLADYVQGLVMQGQLSLDDLFRMDRDQVERMAQILSLRDEALVKTNIALRSKTAELDALNRVSQQRTTQLFSLEEIGRALTFLTDLHELANYVSRKAGELCGADRVICYHLRPDHVAQVLAVQGWDNKYLRQRLDASLVFDDLTEGGSEPSPFKGYPPGIPPRSPDLEGAHLRAGLRVPLIAQHEVVGLLIFHSTRKRSFQPGEVALLQALANQSAVAIQRAGLIDALKEKIIQLEEAQTDIAKKERLERELELGRQMQQSMLPKIFPMVPGMSFAAATEPARQVGGDLYDVFLLDGERVGIVIGDVSDKGLAAALFMALTRSLIYAEARREPSPRIVLNRVHRLLLDLSARNMFVTLFYGVIDAPTRTLTYVRAGHDRPLLVRGGKIEPLEGRGTALGFLEVAEVLLDQVQLELETGDRLVLYTDGLIDALDTNGRAFGLEGLTRSVEGSGGSSLEQMCKTLFEEARHFQEGAEQYDDMTLLLVQVE